MVHNVGLQQAAGDLETRTDRATAQDRKHEANRLPLNLNEEVVGGLRIGMNQPDSVDRHAARKCNERFAAGSQPIVKRQDDDVGDERVTAEAPPFLAALSVKSLVLREPLELSRWLAERSSTDRIGDFLES